ncbi:MAG TPA: DUF262 domain-containing protein, partial [Methylomirabilota bacterium]|nr:DUF262 domain-containing protein [Methylomirabilota bacterium]
VDLINTIDSRLKRVHTQSLDISFNELLDMYKSDELNIHPDYQRLFRWTEGARSRFIESLLLEMPIPPIYVIEEEEGKYILIDGLQRISSYLHLRGELEAEHLDPKISRGEKLVLTDCDIVEELNGKTFDDLGTALQIRLKRAFIRVEVVRRGSDTRFKYHMFKRLNTGGQILTPQQIRNCTIRLLGSIFNDFIIDLSEQDTFKACIENITEEQRLGSFDQELVLRFFALKNYRDQFKHDVDDFLTEYMEKVSDPDIDFSFDYEKERAIFLKTFAIFEKVLGELAFACVNRRRNELTRSFTVYHFEAFTIGIQPYINNINIDDESMIRRLEQVLRNIKLDEEFIR